MLHRINDAHLLPSTVEYARQMLKDVHLPIGICNGQEFLDEDGELLGELFKRAELPYDELDNLFEEKKDLSKYATLAFGTTFVSPELVLPLFDFDKSNLKTVIVFDKTSLHLVKKNSVGLDIKILGFDSIV